MAIQVAQDNFEVNFDDQVRTTQFYNKRKEIFLLLISVVALSKELFSSMISVVALSKVCEKPENIFT